MPTRSSTARLKKDLTQLAVQLCANHCRQANGIKGYCLLEPADSMRCVLVTREDGRCGYFESAVLPTDPELQAMYMADREARAVGAPLTEKELRRVALQAPRFACARCGKDFTPRSNRQTYCPGCRSVVTREKQRSYRRRQKSGGVRYR